MDEPDDRRVGKEENTMKYNDLSISSNRNRKRVGRGIAAGQGKTAGRGTKGQGARTGKKFGPTFQGGQRSLVTAVPKARGFKSIKAPAQTVYLDELNSLKVKTVDNQTLFTAGLIATPYQTVKVIARGQLDRPVTLRVQAASASVKQAITAAGGKFEIVPVPLPRKVDAKPTT